VARAENAAGRYARQTAAVIRAVTYGDDSAMRALADRLPKGAAEPVHEFLDGFHVRAGEARAAGKSWHEGVEMRRNIADNRLQDALGPVLGDKAALEQVVRMVQAPGQIQARGRLGDAARGVRTWLAEHLDYMRKNGVDVGEVKDGYFPRRLDVAAVWKDEAGFRAAAIATYRKAGLSAQDAKASADAWVSDIKTNGTDAGPMPRHSDGLAADHIRGRLLPKETDAIMRKFLVQDPVQVLTGYALATARKAEMSRVMGPKGQKWDALTKALEAAGAQAVLPKIADYVQTQTGNTSSKVPPSVQKALGWVRLWSSVGLLSKAALSSLTDPLIAASRTGNVGDAWRVAKSMTGQIIGTADAQRARALADDIGTVVNHLAGSMAAARFTGEAASDAQNFVAKKYFRAIGLEQWTHGNLVASTSVGDLFLRRMAGDIGASGRHGRQAAFALKELGIADANHAKFAAWLKTAPAEGMDVASLARMTKADPAMADAYRNALFRFTRQAHIMPNAATRPRWASTPLGGAIFHLSAYSYALHSQVLMRAVRMIKDGDLENADKLILGAKIAGSLLLTIPAQMALGELRSQVFDSQKQQEARRERGDRLGQAISRSGLTGAFDPYIQVLTGMRYHKDLATLAAGPAVGRAFTAGQVLASTIQGDTPSVSRSRLAMQAAWDAGLAPAVNTASLFTRLPVAAGVIQLMGSGAMREKFVSATAGPPPPTRRRRDQ
jgi:hypothetical protein